MHEFILINAWIHELIKMSLTRQLLFYHSITEFALFVFTPWQLWEVIRHYPYHSVVEIMH